MGIVGRLIGGGMRGRSVRIGGRGLGERVGCMSCDVKGGRKGRFGEVLIMGLFSEYARDITSILKSIILYGCSLYPCSV